VRLLFDFEMRYPVLPLSSSTIARFDAGRLRLVLRQAASGTMASRTPLHSQEHPVLYEVPRARHKDDTSWPF